MSLDADSAVVLVDDCDTIQCIHPDGDRVCRRSLLLSWPSWMLALGMWQPAAQGAAAPSVALDQEKDGNMYTFKSSLPGQGFSFRYPASDFVIAYDRTQDASRQGAIISIGNFTNTIHTATVFRQSTGDVRVPRTPEDAYKLCIQPLIDDASTTGFRLMQDSLMTTVDGVAIYEYQYEQSICRGQEIVEGVGGVLRCTVRRVYYTVVTLSVEIPTTLFIYTYIYGKGLMMVIPTIPIPFIMM